MKSPKALLLLALFLSACSYRVEKESPVSLNGKALGFAEMQAAVFGPKCSRCHGDWVGSYEGVVSRLEQISARTRSSDPGFQMPPRNAAPLSEGERQSLQDWIARGAPQSGGGGEPPPAPPPEPPPVDPARLNFARIQREVFPKCARCHAPMTGSYELVAAKLTEIESRVRSPLDFEQMPPPRAAQLTEDEKNLLLDWIKVGAPEN